MKYYVSITEILNKVVSVEAENESDAKEIVRKAYHEDCSVQLNWNDYVDAEIKVEDDQEYYRYDEEIGNAEYEKVKA